MKDQEVSNDSRWVSEPCNSASHAAHHTTPHHNTTRHTTPRHKTKQSLLYSSKMIGVIGVRLGTWQCSLSCSRGSPLAHVAWQLSRSDRTFATASGLYQYRPPLLPLDIEEVATLIAFSPADLLAHCCPSPFKNVTNTPSVTTHMSLQGCRAGQNSVASVPRAVWCIPLNSFTCPSDTYTHLLHNREYSHVPCATGCACQSRSPVRVICILVRCTLGNAGVVENPNLRCKENMVSICRTIGCALS